LYAELNREGVERCEAEGWPILDLQVRTDGTGWLEGRVTERDIPYFAKFFIGLGGDADVKEPPELLACIRGMLAELVEKYSPTHLRDVER